MSSIRRIAPKLCPNCEAENTLFIDTDRVLTCRLCGHKQGSKTQTITVPIAAATEDPRERWTVSYGTPLTGELDRWAETKFHSAMDYAGRQNWDEAIKSLQQAIEQQRDFLDAHLWMARLSLDPVAKRHHYGEILANIPNHIESMREMMVLNGQLSREEADRSMNSDEQEIQDADVAVKAQLLEIECSNCGGSLEVAAGKTEVRCQYCGHIEKVQTKQNYGMESLAMAMLKERGQAVKWRVGKYLLHCDNCSAERIITSDKMTVECPFCGSDHVIKADALQSFRQPDGILPFSIDKKEASEALDKELNNVVEKFKNMFSNNRPASINLTPVFLPYWVFDVVSQIIRTRIPIRSNRYDAPTSYADQYAMSQRDEFTDALNDVPYCAVTSPSPRLTSRIEQFELDAVIPYDPKRLANATAQIYTIDFQKASIGVRKDIGERFKFRHEYDASGDYQVTISNMIQQMSFRLVLLPFWLANITEKDGDLRLALIHGQKGKIVLGQAYKPRRK